MAKAKAKTGFDLDHVVRFLHGGGGPTVLPARFGVRARIFPAEQLATFRASDHPWASTTLDDGRILAFSLVGERECHEPLTDAMLEPLNVLPTDEAENPAWCDDARELRGLLLGFLESLPGVDWLEVRIGGNGSATFLVSYGECRLTIAMGRDPNS